MTNLIIKKGQVYRNFNDIYKIFNVTEGLVFMRQDDRNYGAELRVFDLKEIEDLIKQGKLVLEPNE